MKLPPLKTGDAHFQKLEMVLREDVQNIVKEFNGGSLNSRAKAQLWKKWFEVIGSIPKKEVWMTFFDLIEAHVSLLDKVDGFNVIDYISTREFNNSSFFSIFPWLIEKKDGDKKNSDIAKIKIETDPAQFLSWEKTYAAHPWIFKMLNMNGFPVDFITLDVVKEWLAVLPKENKVLGIYFYQNICLYALLYHKGIDFLKELHGLCIDKWGEDILMPIIRPVSLVGNPAASKIELVTSIDLLLVWLLKQFPVNTMLLPYEKRSEQFETILKWSEFLVTEGHHSSFNMELLPSTMKRMEEVRKKTPDKELYSHLERLMLCVQKPMKLASEKPRKRL